MIPHDDISDADIDGWLHTLGIASLCQWDVLVFLYRHPTSLVGADVIARLLGYASDLVVAALDVLEFLGLVDTLPGVPDGAHLSVHRADGPSATDAWARLLALASHRVGRVRLTVRFRGSDHYGPGVAARHPTHSD